jgi:hypothetical protein
MVIGSALSACLLPTDGSADLVVAIDSTRPVLLRGDTLRLFARTFRREATGALAQVRDIALDWRTTDPRIASVTGRPDGSAIVVGFASGRTTLTARAAQFTQAEEAVLHLRVSSPIEIDSIKPDVVRYGEQVTVFGVGVGRLAHLLLQGSELLPDPGAFMGDSSGLGQRSYWVPYPAITGRALGVLSGGLSVSASSPTVVKGADLYHELGLPLLEIDLSGPPARPPDTLFYNPALARTPDEAVDVMRFVPDHDDVTFVFSTSVPTVASFDPTLSADPAPFAGLPDPDASPPWAIGASGQYCKGAFVVFPRVLPRSAPVRLVRALKGLVREPLTLSVLGDAPGRYAVTVLQGYQTADPRIIPDRFEENDFCLGADARARVPLPFADTLTIDNGYETDWYRFAGPDEDGPEEPIIARAVSRPFGAADSSSLAILVADSRARLVAQSHADGQSQTVSAEVGGDFYVIVLEQAGVATRYSLCVAQATTCEFLPESAGARGGSVERLVQPASTKSPP